MHISDGVLSTGITLGGWGIAAGGIVLALRRFDDARAPELGLLTSIFFVASSIGLPVPPLGSVHFLLGGLIGILSGRLALPCIAVALFFQVAFLGHGSVATLGVNTLTLGGGAIASGAIFRALTRSTRSPGRVAVAAFVGGALAVVVSAGLFVGVLAIGAGEGGSQFVATVSVLALVHLAVAPLEGLLVSSAVVFVARVKPELLGWGISVPGTGSSAGSVAPSARPPAPLRGPEVPAA